MGHSYRGRWHSCTVQRGHSCTVGGRECERLDAATCCGFTLASCPLRLAFLSGIRCPLPHDGRGAPPGPQRALWYLDEAVRVQRVRLNSEAAIRDDLSGRKKNSAREEPFHPSTD